MKSTFDLKADKGAVFHKSKVKRMASTGNKIMEKLGPGSYEPKDQIPLYKLKASSGF